MTRWTVGCQKWVLGSAGVEDLHSDVPKKKKKEISLKVHILPRRTAFHDGCEGETCVVPPGGVSVSKRAAPSLPLGLTQSALGECSVFHCPSAPASCAWDIFGQWGARLSSRIRDHGPPAVLHVFAHSHSGPLASPGPAIPVRGAAEVAAVMWVIWVPCCHLLLRSAVTVLGLSMRSHLLYALL